MPRSSSGTTPRLVEPDTEDKLQRLVPARTTGPTGCRSSCRPKKRVAAMLAHTSQQARRGRRPHAADRNSRPWEYTVEKVAVNAVMAGARPEYFPVILALAARRYHGARQHVELRRRDGGGQRPDPRTRSDECRHRRDGALQSRQRHHRAGLWPAVAEPAGRLGAGRDASWARRATTTPTTTSPSPRTRSAARGSRCTCRRDSSRPTAPSACSTAAARPRSAWACARSTGASTCATCWRASTRNSAPCCCSIRITARQFIDRGGFDTKDKLIRWIHETAQMPAGRYWDMQLVQNYIYPWATFGRGADGHLAQGRRPTR